MTELTFLREIGRPRTFEPGAIILDAGTTTDRFFQVVTGRGKMTRLTPAGQLLTLALWQPGDLFGVAPALSGRQCLATHEAVTELDCLEIEVRRIYRYLESHPLTIARVLPWLAGQMTECRNCLVESSCSPVEVRLAHLLLQLAAESGHKNGRGYHVPVSLSRRELAELTGTTAETCSRIMRRWERDGLVETRTDGFLLHDRDRLELIFLS